LTGRYLIFQGTRRWFSTAAGRGFLYSEI